MSSYNCPGYHPANIHREHPELDLKDAVVRGNEIIKNSQFTDKQEIHLEKGTKNNNSADIEVEEEKETQTLMFKCDQCSFATNWNGNLNSHKIVRHKAEEDIVWYKCPKCPKKLKLKGQLKQHLQDAHDEVKKWFTCAHCPFKTKRRTYLINHEISRHAPSESIKWFHCTQCDDYKARTERLLQQHVERKHGQFFFRCDYCPYRSKSKSALRTHEITEHEDCIKWIKCDKCGSKFKDERSLKIHIKRIHKTGEFNDRVVAMPITSEMDILNGYSCALCEFKTLDRVEFSKHPHKTRADKIHLEKQTNNKNWADVEVEEEEEEENNKTETGKFKCHQCSFATNWRSNLNNHKILCHKSEKDVVWYKCPKCPRKLKIKEHLRKHLQCAHDEVKKWFTCAHCPFKTKAKIYLTNHEITRHAPSESIKWFHCTQCDDYKGRTKQLLQRHVKGKHDQFFFTCDYCSYRSKRRVALKTHEIAEHEDCIKWMKCDKCGDKFKDEAKLQIHIKRIHQTDEFNKKMGIANVLREYSCSVCDFKTLDRVEFDKHSHDIKPKSE